MLYNLINSFTKDLEIRIITVTNNE